MESGEGRTLCILRSYLPSRFLWSPIKAAPGELRFDILDPTEKWKAQLMYTFISYIEGRGHSDWVITGGKADTPWGEASFLSGRSHKVVLGERELVTVTDHVSRCDFSFPGKQTISFKKHLGGSLEYIGETARLMISREKGKINPLIMQMGSKIDPSELESLPTMGRPESESNKFVQWRIVASGIVPVDESDFVPSMAMYISILHLNYGRTMDR